MTAPNPEEMRDILFGAELLIANLERSDDTLASGAAVHVLRSLLDAYAAREAEIEVLRARVEADRNAAASLTREIAELKREVEHQQRRAAANFDDWARMRDFAADEARKADAEIGRLLAELAACRGAKP